jgi:prepilin-type N-terminal cleavage/methylation domain-containing protein
VTRRAFTLIELLVVISIILLLVTMLVPVLSQARNLANLAVCGANLHTVGLAVQLYITEGGRDEPWWYTDGHDFCWEPPRPYDMSVSTPTQCPGSWGNPAVALTRDFGPNSARRSDYIIPLPNRQSYLADARAFFCPLFQFRYEQHYSRYGHGNLWMVDNATKVWGTYVWMWPKKQVEWRNGSLPVPSQIGKERTYNNGASNNVLLLDYFGYDWQPTWWADKSMMEYRQSMYHWQALMLDGSVQGFTRCKDVFSWLWTNQPGDPRQYFDPTYPSVFRLPDYVPG